MEQPKLQTNLDTSFLKLVAIVSMTIDHVGTVFFPQYPVFRWIGRLAFPIFCYCMTVGLLYTGNLKRYFGRLGIFALISQPFYVLAFQPYAFWENFFLLNIFFTLMVSLLGLWGVAQKKWWVVVAAVFLLSIFNLDYSVNGLILMVIFYFCRNKPWLGGILYGLNYLPALWGAYPGDPLALHVGSLWVDFTIFAIAAGPLIFLRTHVQPKIPKWFFYWFYPAHLAVIGLVRILLGV